MKRVKHIAALVLLTASAGVSAAPATYIFDSVSRFDIGHGQFVSVSRVSLTGILQNTATPTTVTIDDMLNSDLTYVINRCVPVFLTMMDKPGRYRLSVTTDPDINGTFVSCGLEVKS